MLLFVADLLRGLIAIVVVLCMPMLHVVRLANPLLEECHFGNAVQMVMENVMVMKDNFKKPGVCHLLLNKLTGEAQ